MTRKIWRRSVGGVVDMTPEEEALRDQQEADVAARKVIWKQEKEAKDARIASVKIKLEALGLTTNEIKDAFGIGS